jgi:hypothetical protein
MICKNCGKDNPAEARYCAGCGASLDAATVSRPAAAWAPGVTSSYGNGWRKLWKNFPTLLVVFITLIVISNAINIPSWIGRISSYGSINPLWQLITFAYLILLSGVIGYGVLYACLKSARGDSLQIKDVFEAFRNYWNAVLVFFLVGVITAIGSVFLIIPGIYFACKLSFTPYLVVDRKMKAINAIKESWRLTNGHFWKIFLTGLLAIPIVIGGAICLGIGIIISYMWVDMAFASLYHAVSTSGTPSPAPGTGAPAT